MNRLRHAFAELVRTQRKALLPYITAGYPDVETTLALLRRMNPQRCACVELGIPFSDPIADGPVIQMSFSRALERGFRLDALLAGLRAARDEIAVPLVAMVSYSIVYRRGAEAFCSACREAGIGGLIVPDVSIEEASELAEVGARVDCPIVLIVAPTTSPERWGRIAALSEPFIYYQSVAGVTGERPGVPAETERNVQRLRQAANKPVCVGFGVSQPAHVAAVCRVADGAIVGSAIVRRMNEGVERGENRETLVAMISSLIENLSSLIPRTSDI